MPSSAIRKDLASEATDDGLGDDDIVGAFTWDPDLSLEAMPNIARGKYVDASTASLYQLVNYPEVALPSPDGQDRIFPLDLGFVESPSYVQRIAKQVLQRSSICASLVRHSISVHGSTASATSCRSPSLPDVIARDCRGHASPFPVTTLAKRLLLFIFKPFSETEPKSFFVKSGEDRFAAHEAN